MAQFAELVRMQLTANDLCGRFGGNGFLILLDRGTARDVETWAENVVKRVGDHTFQFEEKNLSATVTVGLGLLPPSNPDVSAAIADAVNAARRGRELGGNQMYAVDKSDTDTRVQAYDKIWVKHIKTRADGESLPAGSTAHRESSRRRQGHVRRAGPHARRTGQRSAARGVHRRRRAQRSDEEHRPLGHRRLHVLRRQPQGRLHLRTRLQGHDTRQEPDRLARDAAEIAQDRAQAPVHPGHGRARDAVRAPDHRALGKSAQAGLPLRARAFRHRPRPLEAARRASA